MTLTACEATTCDVEVVGATTGWRAFIGTAETGPFTNRVVGVHNVYLEAKFGPDARARRPVASARSTSG
ncbi:MAG: hypothetical protein IPQ07_02275 [Myxococcales bacterium]|nr:hypothetical protein [Myxococcales bacterium]